MTENLEPKSQSENTSPDQNAAVILPLAIQYHARVPLDDQTLIEAFDIHWTKHGEDLANKFYKGKKSKGGSLNLTKARKSIESTIGVTQLYSNLLINILGEIVEEQAGKRIMSVTDLTLSGFKDDTVPTQGIIQYYYWPQMTLRSPLNFELEREEFDIVAAFSKRCMDLRRSSRTYEVAEEITGVDQRLNMDIITSINGKPSSDHSKRGIWLDFEDLSQEEVKEAVLKAKKGDLIELSFPDGEDEINMHVKIHDVNDINYLDLDGEELYAPTGFKSKDEYFNAFRENLEANQVQAEKAKCYESIINQIMLNSDMDAIPQSWISSNINRFVDRHVESQGNDLKKALKVLNVDTEQDMRDLYEHQVFKETVQQMATLWYAAEFDCPIDAQSIASHIHSKIIWV